MTSEIARTDTRMVSVIPDDQRQIALLRAVGLDRYPQPTQELAISIANRYGLDLMLKHLVIIEGRPYITRDGLLHVAHRSSQFDGIEVTDPVLDGDYWRAKASVWRKDMSHPFTYSGRYPKTGGNAKFAPEMAVKVAEVMALRRAFDVAAPVMEERWDVDAEAIEPVEQQTARSVLAERAAQVRQVEAREADRAPDNESAYGDTFDPSNAGQVAAFFDAPDGPNAAPDDLPRAEAAASTATATEEAPDVTVGQSRPLPLTKKELNDRIIERSIRLPDIKAVASEMFGTGHTLGDLTDDQRGALWARFEG